MCHAMQGLSIREENSDSDKEESSSNKIKSTTVVHTSIYSKIPDDRDLIIFAHVAK